MNNPIGWVEIPTLNLSRAMRFYEHLFGWQLEETTLGPVKMAFLPSAEDAIGCSGALVHNENYKPSDEQGMLIYFNCVDVQKQVDRVLHAGGTVLSGKTQIAPDIGYMALALDSEGNRIAFHSRQ